MNNTSNIDEVMFQWLVSLSETLTVLAMLESEIYGIELKNINTKWALFPTVSPFLHSFYKLSCNRPFDAGLKDKILPPPGV